jgi:hypothetical protein
MGGRAMPQDPDFDALVPNGGSRNRQYKLHGSPI